MNATTARPAGLATTLRAALNAGLMNGLIFGLVDGVIAGRATALRGVFEWLGCLGLAVISYGCVWIAVLLAVGIALHPWMRSRGQDLYARFGVLLTFGLGLGLFLEAYWWSRPYLLSGVSATDPRRVAAAAGMLAASLGAAWLCRRLARRLPAGLRMAATVSVPALWIIGALFAFVVRSNSSGRGEIHERNRDLPNVLLIVCDALRADTLGFAGHPRARTPVLDELASRGVVFSNALVTAPFTWASFGSILTGKYPRRHGLVKMDPRRRMLPSNITLPWHLKSAKRLDGGAALEEQDYLGATFMTGTLSHGSGLTRGFDIYYEALVGHDVVDTASPWSVFRSKLVLSILRDKLAQSFDASRVVSVATDWFREHTGKRFVSMVHLYSTHTPYDPPREFRELYCDPKYDGPIRSFYAEHRIAVELGQVRLTPADAAQIENLYLGGVSQADAMIGEVLATLRGQGALENTLVIVTSDHGESLGEHGQWEHNWPFQDNLRVPLILSWPRALPSGVTVAQGVQSIDIFPTVTELLGLRLPDEALGQDPAGHIDGISLVSLIRDAAKDPAAASQLAPPRPHAFSENEVFLAVQDTAPNGARYKLVVPANADCSTLLRSPPKDGIPPRLYRLDVDPMERTDRLAEEPDQAQRLLDALCAWDRAMPIPQDMVLESDRDTVDRERLMKVLGY